MNQKEISDNLTDFTALAQHIKRWGNEVGFAATGITNTDLSAAEIEHNAWLSAGFHGEMDYMASHGSKRTRPAELVPGTIRVITVRMNYLPDAEPMQQVLTDGSRAAISRYALGRDYHKLMRARLQKLADKISEELKLATPDTDFQNFGYRVFTDSAPVLEVALAEKSGLGWRGKHSLLLNREAGSYFFLGEIYTNLPLPIDAPQAAHCGTCTSCINICPTQAIVAPYQVDARRCISYLTIELKGSIPNEFRPLIGNRVYGCDDCQMVCPWNRFAQLTQEADFQVRHGLDSVKLVDLFSWSEADFRTKMAGSAIYRIGYERWLRNLAVGLGNAPTSTEVITALKARRDDVSALVREHVGWALAQHQ